MTVKRRPKHASSHQHQKPILCFLFLYLRRPCQRREIQAAVSLKKLNKYTGKLPLQFFARRRPETTAKIRLFIEMTEKMPLTQQEFSFVFSLQKRWHCSCGGSVQTIVCGIIRQEKNSRDSTDENLCNSEPSQHFYVYIHTWGLA